MRRAGVPEPEITKLEYDAERNRTTIQVEHPLVMDLAAGLVNFFDSSGAPNFVEMQIGTSRGLFVVTVKPLDGKTPGDVVAELKERVSELEKYLIITADDMERWADSWALEVGEGADLVLRSEAQVLRQAVGQEVMNV
jgi:hypothetical protein